MKSKPMAWMKLNPPTRRRAGFHPRRGFHRQRRFIPPARVDLVEKNGNRITITVLFCVRTLILKYCAPRGPFFRLRGVVFRPRGGRNFPRGGRFLEMGRKFRKIGFQEILFCFQSKILPKARVAIFKQLIANFYPHARTDT